MGAGYRPTPRCRTPRPAHPSGLLAVHPAQSTPGTRRRESSRDARPRPMLAQPMSLGTPCFVLPGSRTAPWVPMPTCRPSSDYSSAGSGFGPEAAGRGEHLHREAQTQQNDCTRRAARQEHCATGMSQCRPRPPGRRSPALIEARRRVRRAVISTKSASGTEVEGRADFPSDKMTTTACGSRPPCHA